MGKPFGATQARRYYDRFAAKQDRQGWYEDAALAKLLEWGDFGRAEAVLEAGCGTGRFAAHILAQAARPDLRYTGLDISSEMLKRARGRLAPFTKCVRLIEADATRALPFADESFDRFVATYLIDLLPPADASAMLGEAHRVLRPGGLACLASLTSEASGVLPRAFSSLWSALHRLAPHRVGGCRPVALARLFEAAGWDVVHREVVTPNAVASEVIVARRCE